MQKLFILPIVLLTCYFSNVHGQESVNFKHALNIELGLPLTIHNEAFAEFTEGVFHNNINYQYRFKNNGKLSPIVGLGTSINYLTIKNYKIVGLNRGGLFSYGGFAKFGFESKNDDFTMDYHVKAGYYFMNSRNRQGPIDADQVFVRNYEHFFIEPGINFTYLIDEISGFTFGLSYTIRDMKFKSHHLALGELPGFANAPLNGITGQININFGYKIYLNKPRRSSDF
jgi:hypothetical protein